MNHRNLHKRGFSLVLVLVVGVAAFVVATTLLSMRENAATRAAHAVQGERAEAIARAGFERALAYMAPLVEDTGDFDKVLDPTLTANCAALPIGPAVAAATSNRPNFSDGAAITYRGKQWTRVPYDDGAYFIRFDDDNDDNRDEPLWAARTSNNAVNNCFEGPASLGGGGGGGGGEGGGEGGGGGGGGGGEPADNPFRDRNGAVWVTVIGIAPGLDPDRAVHRATLRRLHHIANAGAAGLVVKGNVNIGGSGNLEACSPVGSLEVDGNISVGGSGTGCACGDSRADIFNNFDHCNDLAGSCASVGCALGSLSTPGPTPPDVEDWRSAAGANFFFDFTQSCLFVVDDNAGGPSALWVWDAARTVNGTTACNTFNGSGLPFPDPDPADTSGFGQCWTPLLLNIGSTPVVPMFVGEGNLTSWTPLTGGAVTATAAVNLLLIAEGFPPYAAAGATLNKPNWANCRVDHPGDGTAHDRCTTCNGTNRAMELNSGRFWFNGDTANEINAVPAGAYIYRNNLQAITGSAADFSAPAPLDPLDMRNYPLVTLVVDGNIDIQANTYLGVGAGLKSQANFPSIIGNGTLSYSGSPDQYYAGSVWLTGNWNWNGGGDAFLYGELHTNGNWDVSGSGDFFWRYRTPLSAATGTLTSSAPTTYFSLE